MGSVIAASSCCLPLFPLVFAAGAAGASAFLTAARPYLLILSAVSIVYGFFQAWKANQCHRRPSILSSSLLWISALFFVVSIFFPQLLANAAADLLAR